MWYQKGVPVQIVSRIAAVDSGVTVAGGAFGSSANQFRGPWGVVVNDSGYLYVSDRNNYRVMRFPPGSTAGTAGSYMISST